MTNIVFDKNKTPFPIPLLYPASQIIVKKSKSGTVAGILAGFIFGMFFGQAQAWIQIEKGLSTVLSFPAYLFFFSG
jgi:fructose-specific phosphotransferase system IIC component